MELLSADEAREALEKSGALAVPNVNTLKNSPLKKVYSGKKADGSLWKVHRETEDGFIVEC